MSTISYPKAAGQTITAADANIMLEKVQQGTDTDGIKTLKLNITGGTSFNMTITGTPTVARTFTLPDVASDTFVLLTATQTLSGKTLTSPTIGDFTNANHNHQNAGGGGQLSITAATTGTLTETRGGTNQTTYTTGDILYASGANTLSKLPIGTNGFVLTVSGGVPVWSVSAGDITDVIAGAGLTGGGSSGSVTLDVGAGTGITVAADTVSVDTTIVATTNNTLTLSNKTLTAPKFVDLGFIADTNGNELLIFDSIASAVNEITLSNAITGTNPSLAVTGGDVNISLNLVSKGTGTVKANNVDVVTTTGTQTLTNKTLTAPTIGDFTNATHSHQNAAGGGQISITAATTGTLTETRGGTNQTTYTTGDIIYASGANTLSKLPIGSTNQVLTVSGGVPVWAAGGGGGGTPGGANTQVQFNDAGAFGGDAAFTFNKTTKVVTLTQSTNAQALSLNKTGTGAGSVLTFSNSGTGKDITGSSGTWEISKTGKLSIIDSSTAENKLEVLKLNTGSGNAASFRNDGAERILFLDHRGTGGGHSVEIDKPGTGSGNLIHLTNGGSGLDIRGNAGNWSVSKTGVFIATPVAKGTTGGAITIDWSAGKTQTITLNANTTFTFTNGVNGTLYRLRIKQDGTGGRTVTWPADVRFSGGTGPTLTTTANKVDYVGFYFDSADAKFDMVSERLNF